MLPIWIAKPFTTQSDPPPIHSARNCEDGMQIPRTRRSGVRTVPSDQPEPRDSGGTSTFKRVVTAQELTPRCAAVNSCGFTSGL